MVRRYFRPMVVYDTLRSDASEDFWVHKWVSASLESPYLVHPGRWTLMNAKCGLLVLEHWTEGTLDGRYS